MSRSAQKHVIEGKELRMSEIEIFQQPPELSALTQPPIPTMNASTQQAKTTSHQPKNSVQSNLVGF